MATVYLNLGSNIEREQNLGAGIRALREQFGELVLSSVYESEAVGFSGDAFFNLAVELQTTLEPGPLAASLRQLEYRYGREPHSQRFSPRTLDIDVLSYDDRVGLYGGLELPRPEVLYNAFVLWPLAELAGDVLHPIARRSYRELWSEFDRDSQQITRVGPASLLDLDGTSK